MQYFRSSQNSSGVDTVIAHIEDGLVLGAHGMNFVPPAKVADVGTGRDWRTHNWFVSREEAVADYLKTERSRIERAERAIAEVSA